MNLQEYYDIIMQLSHGIVVTLDLDGGIIHGNSLLESLSGYSMQELVGKDWFDIFLPEVQREEVRNEVLGQSGAKDVARISGRIVSKNGDRTYIDWNLKALSEFDGEITSILCVGQDVTAHMVRQKGLLRERYTLIERNKELNCLYEISRLGGDVELGLKETLERIVNLLPSGFQDPDRTHVRLQVGSLTWESCGFRNTENVLLEPIESSQDIRGSITVCVEGEAGPGRPFFINSEKDILTTAAQQISIIVAKKEIRSAKQELERQLRQADRLAKIGQFSAGVAHEINEPLSNILGYAQLARQASGLPEQVRKDIDNIVDSSLHAREIIKKIMLFSRQLPPQFTPTNLNECISEGLRITENAANRNEIVVQCDFDAELPLVSADPQHIKQVIVNLAANAIQAMENGGLLGVKTLGNGNDVYVIVEDSGPGIPKDELRQIFNPFFTTKDVDKGTGLGLSVVLGIVKAHKGFIQVHSEPGQGTRFELAFPCMHNK